MSIFYDTLVFPTKYCVELKISDNKRLQTFKSVYKRKQVLINRISKIDPPTFAVEMLKTNFLCITL